MVKFRINGSTHLSQNTSAIPLFSEWVLNSNHCPPEHLEWPASTAEVSLLVSKDLTKFLFYLGTCFSYCMYVCTSYVGR